MYDVGQGDSIKEGNGKVFSIKLKETIADTLYPCHFTEPDTSKQPTRIPLGAYDRRVLDDYNGYKTLGENYENYEPVTQHTKAGEISDMGLLLGVGVLCVILVFFLTRK
jgi:hypothetical protein